MDTSDWILLAISFYGFVLTATALYVFVLRHSSLFEPIGQYLFFVTLFSLPLPIRAAVTSETVGNVSAYLPEFVSYLPIALVLTALSLPIFAVGYYSRFARRLGERMPLMADRNLRGTRVGVIALVALSSVLIYLLTKDIGGFLPFLLLGYNSTEATFGIGYLAVGFPWLVVAMAVMLDRYSVSRHKLDLLAFGVLLLANLAIHLVTGNRTMMLYLAVVLAILTHYRIRRISFAFLAPVAIAGFIGLNVAGTFRSSDYETLSDFAEQTLTSVESTGDVKESLFYTLTIGEFVVPFETLPQMIRTIGISEWPWFGASFLRSPVYLIPSAIFPDRPPSLANWYMSKYYGEGYGLNEGRQFFFLAEGYLNFGPAGVVLVAAAWGLLWGALHRWMQRGRNRFGVVLVYALAVGYMFRCIAGDFTTLLVGITQQSLVAVAFVILISRMFGANRNEENSEVKAT